MKIVDKNRQGHGADVLDDPQQMKKKIDLLEQENKQLQEQIRLLLAKLYGPKTEKARFSHPSLFNEAEILQDQETEGEEQDENQDQEQTTTVPAHERKKPKRKPLPAELPRIEVIHELPPEKRFCPHDNTPLKVFGQEVSEQLDIIPAQVRVIRHIRYKYGCPCCEEGVHTAPVPKLPIPKSIASAGLLAHIAVAKYEDALPLYRQTNILQRSGIDISRASMSSWMIKLAALLMPLINLMRDSLLDDDYIKMDETTVQVIKEKERPGTSKSYMWLQRSGHSTTPIILFTYEPRRTKEVPVRLLEGFQGHLQTDGYEGYGKVCAQSSIIHLGCWAHARRKFDEALKARSAKGRKQKGGKAGHALKMIQKLYGIERKVKHASPEERHIVRQKESRPIVEELRAWLTETLPLIPPSSLTGKALGYLHNQWDKLVRYLNDGRLSMDNNQAENDIRPFVLGRKNWLFSYSTRGAEASAVIYSVIQTAKANGQNPVQYLRYVIELLPQTNTIDEIEALLPWNCNPPQSIT